MTLLAEAPLWFVHYDEHARIKIGKRAKLVYPSNPFVGLEHSRHTAMNELDVNEARRRLLQTLGESSKRLFVFSRM